jgi:hypothetical protein
MILLIAILLLLSVVVLRTSPVDSIECQHELAFEAPFGAQDHKMQSVSHEFDHLWEGMAGNSTTLDLPDPRLNNQLLETSISM